MSSGNCSKKVQVDRTGQEAVSMWKEKSVGIRKEKRREEDNWVPLTVKHWSRDPGDVTTRSLQSLQETHDSPVLFILVPK